MLSNGVIDCGYDSLNRLVYTDDRDYIYNAENVRICNLCAGEDTTYVYNTNCKLSQLLVKTTNGVTTKYVYGLGLIGEEVNNTFKTYHFDNRGSTIAITDMSGNVTDTFAYDTYGKQLSHVGTSDIIFGYNGRDGVVTDSNGLIYMRARYYSPDMRRFINSDLVAGKINNAVTLNRYAYANANPAMNVDPNGLLAVALAAGLLILGAVFIGTSGSSKRDDDDSMVSDEEVEESQPEEHVVYNEHDYKVATESGQNVVLKKPSSSSSDGAMIATNPNKSNSKSNNKSSTSSSDDLEQKYIIAKEKAVEEALDTTIDWSAQKIDKWAGYGDLVMPDKTPPSVYIKGASKVLSGAMLTYDVANTVVDNYREKEPWQETVSDVGIQVAGMGWSTAWGVIGTAVGTLIAPGVGTVLGIALPIVAEYVYRHDIAPSFDDYFSYN